MARAARRLPTASLTESRLIIVSGKGGVGKTTVASAIALAASSTGRRTLIVEVEQREAIAPLFGRPPTGYEERALAPNLTGLSVSPDVALVEYLYLFYGIGRIARPLLTSRAVEFATATAPGLRDILLIGKVKEAEGRRSAAGPVYDLIVLDAPPSGRLPRFLDAPRAVVDLVSSGTIRQQAQGVLDMLVDPNRTRVVLVTHAEEMPVREAVETADAMKRMGIAAGPVIVNGLLPVPFTPAQQKALSAHDGEALAAEAEAAGIALSEADAATVATTSLHHARRAATQRRALKQLTAEYPHEQVHLPALMTTDVGPNEVRRLADELIAQGAFA